MLADTGARLWVNGQLLVDGWSGAAVTPVSATLQLSAGQRSDVRLEYHTDGAGHPSVRLSWTYAGQAEQVVPASQLFPAAPADALVPSPITRQ